MPVSLYRYSLHEAESANEAKTWRESHKENIRCRDFIDKMVSERYSGNILPSEIIKDACAEFGIDRVGWVLATTVVENDYDGRYRPDTKQWARTAFYLPNDEANEDFELRTHPELVNGMVGQYRKFLSEDLGLLTKDACLPKSNESDYTDQLLIMRSDSLAEAYKKGEFQYFYARAGFGCSPTDTGRKVFGFFVSDGEKARFERADFLGIADRSKCPDWVIDNLEKHLYEGKDIVEFGDSARIAVPKTPIDCSSMTFFDELEYDCWHLVEKYCKAFGIDVLPDRNGDTDISFDIAKSIQEHIIEDLKGVGVQFQFDQKITEDGGMKLE